MNIKQILVTTMAIVAINVYGAGIASASIPDGSGVINGCYKAGSEATLSVVDTANSSCKSGETMLPWNQTGPQGPVGVTGATGPQGPAGPSTAGPTGLDVVTVENNGSSGPNNIGLVVFCPNDHPYAVGGGGVATDFGTESASQIVESRPVGAEGPSNYNVSLARGWWVQGSKTNLFEEVYAICSK